MRLRYVYLFALLVLPFQAEAQITLDESDFPLRIGTNPYVSLSTSNVDGSNTVALETLIAQVGPNQTYDFTGVTFEDQIDGEITVEAGATGPAAAAEPLNQASLTATFPFMVDEGGVTAEGTIYFYHLVTEEASVELGSFFLGESGGMNIALAILNTPDGQLDATFPTAFGSMWSSDFTQVINFDGFEIESDVSETAEVDGWGTLLVPGIEAGVPALRVKVTTTITTNGITTTDVCYELRSNQPVAASVCEGDEMVEEPPTADIARLGSVSTAGEVGSEPLVAALAPAFPNPARDAVTLTYDVPQAGAVALVVYDVLGRDVLRVVDGAQPAGRYAETLDTGGLAPGVYIARLTVDGQHWTRRLTIAR
ncbi:MAG: T9SS type A sorting domain-containing protein [Rhodothermales bacterium]